MEIPLACLSTNENIDLIRVLSGTSLLLSIFSPCVILGAYGESVGVCCALSYFTLARLAPDCL